MCGCVIAKVKLVDIRQTRELLGDSDHAVLLIEKPSKHSGFIQLQVETVKTSI